MFCCNNNCKNYEIYDIGDLIDCDLLMNVQQLCGQILEEYQTYGVFSFISSDDFKQISGYIEFKWMNIWTSIQNMFENRKFIGRNDVNEKSVILRNQCLITNTVKIYLIQKIEYIIMQTYFMNLDNHGRRNKNINIYTVNDEPLRKTIDSPDEMMLGNIRNQTSTDVLNLDTDLQNSMKDFIAMNNEFNKISNDLIFIINNIVVDYIPSIHGYFCWKENIER